LAAGERGVDGTYPANTVHGHVNRRLSEFVKRYRSAMRLTPNGPVDERLPHS
jgi:hypothetical protein